MSGVENWTGWKRELYLKMKGGDLAAKRQLRSDVLSQIESKRGMVKVLQQESRDLAESLESDWVLRSRQLRQRVTHGGTGAPAGSESYYGSRNPGTQWLVQGFIYSNPLDEGVQVFKHPDSALFAAQCAADRDRKYLDKWYVVEVVDRKDGEVYAEITTRSDYANENLGQYPPKGK